MDTELVVRFGYGARVPWVHRQEDGTLRAIAGAHQAVLRTTVVDPLVEMGELRAQKTCLQPVEALVVPPQAVDLFLIAP